MTKLRWKVEGGKKNLQCFLVSMENCLKMMLKGNKHQSEDVGWKDVFYIIDMAAGFQSGHKYAATTSSSFYYRFLLFTPQIPPHGTAVCCTCIIMSALLPLSLKWEIFQVSQRGRVWQIYLILANQFLSQRGYHASPGMECNYALWFKIQKKTFHWSLQWRG